MTLLVVPLLCVWIKKRKLLIQPGFDVITVSREVKLRVIYNRNVFYLYTVTCAACSSTPYYAHAWLYKGFGYCTDLSVPCLRPMVGITRSSKHGYQLPRK